jgi:hypothetical protein
MKYCIEYTDTFSGEANYSWKQSATFEAPDTASTPLLVRRGKRALGLSGPHRTEEWGDTIAVYPRGTCTVAFISVLDAEDEYRSEGRTGV